jgi:hypothetical protein
MIALLISVSAGAAAAECAWILWEEKELSLFGKQASFEKWWKIQDSYTTYEACAQGQRATWEAVARQCESGKCPGVQEVKKVLALPELP